MKKEEMHSWIYAVIYHVMKIAYAYNCLFEHSKCRGMPADITIHHRMRLNTVSNMLFCQLKRPTIKTHKTIIAKIVVLIFAIFLLTSCWHDRTFYIDEINTTMAITNIAGNLYRIYISESKEISGKDYIDFYYNTYDMSPISLCFSPDGSKNIHILVECYSGSVEEIVSSNYEFTLLQLHAPYKELTDEEIIEKPKIIEQIVDSLELNSLIVQFEPGLMDISIKNYMSKE